VIELSDSEDGNSERMSPSMSLCESIDSIDLNELALFPLIKVTRYRPEVVKERKEFDLSNGGYLSLEGLIDE
jgi:hypothetical protein